MPSKFTIPARTKRHCEPCEFHKCTAALMGGPGNVWRQYSCMHPEAFNDSPLSEDQAVRDKQIEIRTSLLQYGRNIGKTESQPPWCPLLREQDSPKEKGKG